MPAPSTTCGHDGSQGQEPPSLCAASWLERWRMTGSRADETNGQPISNLTAIIKFMG
jgi:hypothetical protein